MTDFYLELLGRETVPIGADLHELLAALFPSDIWKYEAFQAGSRVWSARYPKPDEERPSDPVKVPQLIGSVTAELAREELEYIQAHAPELVRDNPETHVGMTIILTLGASAADLLSRPFKFRALLLATVLPIPMDEGDRPGWIVDRVFDPLLGRGQFLFGRAEPDYRRFPPMYGIDLERSLWVNCPRIAYFGPELAGRLPPQLKSLVTSFALGRLSESSRSDRRWRPDYVKSFPDGGVRAHFIANDPEEILFV